MHAFHAVTSYMTGSKSLRGSAQRAKYTRVSACYGSIEVACENESKGRGRAFGISGVAPASSLRLHTPGNHACSMSYHAYHYFCLHSFMPTHSRTSCSPNTSAEAKGTVGKISISVPS